VIPGVSVVIPSWNTRELLAECLGALPPDVEICVVDNASDDGSAECVERDFPHVRLVRNAENLGFARACNQGARETGRAYVLLLNADARVSAGAIESLATFLDEHPAYGGVAPHLLNPDGTTQRGCMAFPNLKTPVYFGGPIERWFPNSPELERYFCRGFDHERDADVQQPPAAAFLVRRELYEELGGLDEELWLFYNDVDLCKRMQARGARLRYLTGPTVVHVKGASTSQFADFAPEWHRNRLAYYRKHHGRVAGMWVKLCTAVALMDHVVRAFGRRVRGEKIEPLYPLCRSFGTFLIS